MLYMQLCHSKLYSCLFSNAKVEPGAYMKDKNRIECHQKSSAVITSNLVSGIDHLSQRYRIKSLEK